MSTFVVWDAGKERANIYELEGSKYAEYRETLLQSGVSGTAVAHFLLDKTGYSCQIVSPGAYERAKEKAKNDWAMRDPGQDIETEVPVTWHVREESDEESLV